MSDWRGGDACCKLVPLETDLQEAVERSLGKEVLDKGQDASGPLLKTEAAPSEAPGPWRAESALGQRLIDGARLDLFAFFFRGRGGAEGVVYLSEPDSEQSRPRFEVCVSIARKMVAMNCCRT